MDQTPPSVLSSHWGAAADEAQDLHSISLFQTSLIEVLSFQDFQIQLDRHTLGFDGEFTQQIAHRGISPTAPLLTIHLDLNRVRHGPSS